MPNVAWSQLRWLFHSNLLPFQLSCYWNSDYLYSHANCSEPMWLGETLMWLSMLKCPTLKLACKRCRPWQCSRDTNSQISAMCQGHLLPEAGIAKAQNGHSDILTRMPLILSFNMNQHESTNIGTCFPSEKSLQASPPDATNCPCVEASLKPTRDRRGIHGEHLQFELSGLANISRIVQRPEMIRYTKISSAFTLKVVGELFFSKTCW